MIPINIYRTIQNRFLVNIFDIPSDELDDYFNNIFFYISFVSISIFDTYCFIEQIFLENKIKVTQTQVQYFNAPFIWVDSKITKTLVNVVTNSDRYPRSPRRTSVLPHFRIPRFFFQIHQYHHLIRDKRQIFFQELKSVTFELPKSENASNILSRS